jgi:hypothetical protein
MQAKVVATPLNDQGERFPNRRSRFSVFLFHSLPWFAVAMIAKGVAIFLVTSCALAHASTYRVSPEQSYSAIQRDIFNLAPGCKSPTTIQYLWFQNAGGIFVITTNANLTITRNQFTGLPCCASQAHSPAIYFDGGRNPKDPTAQILSNATVTWNTCWRPHFLHNARCRTAAFVHRGYSRKLRWNHRAEHYQRDDHL